MEAEKFITAFTIARHNYAFQLHRKVVVPAILMLYPDQDMKCSCHQSTAIGKQTPSHVTTSRITIKYLSAYSTVRSCN